MQKSNKQPGTASLPTNPSTASTPLNRTIRTIQNNSKKGVLVVAALALSGVSFVSVTGQDFNAQEEPTISTQSNAKPLDVSLTTQTDTKDTSPTTPPDSAELRVNGEQIPIPPNETVNNTVTSGDGTTSHVSVSSSVNSDGSTNSETEQSTKLRVKSSSSTATNTFNASINISTDSDTD